MNENTKLTCKYCNYNQDDEKCTLHKHIISQEYPACTDHQDFDPHTEYNDGFNQLAIVDQSIRRAKNAFRNFIAKNEQNDDTVIKMMVRDCKNKLEEIEGIEI